MVKYAKIIGKLSFIFPIAFVLLIFMGLDNRIADRLWTILIIVFAALVFPLLLVKCKNCGVFVYLQKHKGKSKWRVESALIECPSCGKNPLENDERTLNDK